MRTYTKITMSIVSELEDSRVHYVDKGFCVCDTGSCCLVDVRIDGRNDSSGLSDSGIYVQLQLKTLVSHNPMRYVDEGLLFSS